LIYLSDMKNDMISRKRIHNDLTIRLAH